MGARTRGYAPGYDVSPLRGDLTTPNTSSPAEQPPPAEHIAPLQGHPPALNGHRPEGAKDSTPGRRPGVTGRPRTPPAPKGRSIPAQGVALGSGAPPHPSQSPEGAKEKNPASFVLALLPGLFMPLDTYYTRQNNKRHITPFQCSLETLPRPFWAPRNGGVWTDIPKRRAMRWAPEACQTLQSFGVGFVGNGAFPCRPPGTSLCPKPSCPASSDLHGFRTMVQERRITWFLLSGKTRTVFSA